MTTNGLKQKCSARNNHHSDTEANGKIRLVAVVTGITGQDGTYLAELLLSKGYEVHGLTGIRRAGKFHKHRIELLYENPSLESSAGKFQLHYGDLTDSSGLTNIIKTIRPTEIYNLAAQSNVKESFELGEYTMNVDGLGTLRLLNAILAAGLNKQVRFYQASTSELYGKVQQIPQNETTPFYPQSPYGCAKLFAHWIVKNYREAYGIYACNGILFNHESPRRGEAFVTRKITQSVARISVGRQEYVELGNLDAVRDWGHAKDYVEAMWLMLQQEEADDYVISTGVAHSVRHFVEVAFSHVGITIQWDGTGVDEVGKEKATGIIRVKVNPKYYRPIEIDAPLGDCSKARHRLGWTPIYNFKLYGNIEALAIARSMNARPRSCSPDVRSLRSYQRVKLVASSARLTSPHARFPKTPWLDSAPQVTSTSNVRICTNWTGRMIGRSAMLVAEMVEHDLALLKVCS